MGVGPVGSASSSRICCGLCGAVVIRSGKWSARWARRCLGFGGFCVSRVGFLPFRGGAGPVIWPWSSVKKSHVGSQQV